MTVCRKKALIGLMKRGILVLTANELIELTKNINVEKFHLATKDLKEENRILVNDEELENILDDIGRPEDNEILKNIANKISELLLCLRNS